MNRAGVHEGIRRTRFEDVLGRAQRSELSQVEAAELLGVSERCVSALAGPSPGAGDVAGLSDGRLRPSLRRALVAEIERMLGLYRDLYRGFTAKHFHEQLTRRHGCSPAHSVSVRSEG